MNTTINPNTKSLGAGLREARELKNLTLRAVEQAVGISNAYLSQLENDKIKKPSPFFLHKLAKLYELSYERLMAAAGYAGDASTDASPRSFVEGRLFNEKLITPEEGEELVKFLGYLRSKK
jgi:HTH-type transcriptional regulator, competence development regulator